MSKRRPITQLPAINRTATLERFFGSTVDQLFQPGSTSAISGYIGRVPSYNDPLVDFYKSEPTAARQKYQLEATMISTDTSDAISNILFYDDLISGLSAAGCLVSDTDRLFESEYWSWAPPVDIDMLNNFQQYYWSGDDVPAVTLTLPGMEVPTIYKSDGTTTTFVMPDTQTCWRIMPQDQLPGLDGDTLFPGCPVALVDGIRTTAFTIVSNTEIAFTVAPENGAIVEVYRYGNIGDGVRTDYAFPNILEAGFAHDDSDVHVWIDGRAITDFTVMGGDHITLSTPAPMNSLVTVTIFDSLDTVITGQQYFDIGQITNDGVENLINGLRIALVDPYVAFFGFDIKANATFKWDEMQPSIFMVDGVGISIHLTDLTSELVGLDPQYIVIGRDDPALSYFSRINRWVQAAALAWFGGNTVDRQATRPICAFLSGMALFNYGRSRAPDADIVYGVWADYDPASLYGADDSGRIPAAGDVVLFGDVDNPALNNNFFVWPAIDDDTDPSTVIMPLLAAAQINDVFRDIDSGNEYRFTGNAWLLCQTPGTFPLFDLFDNDGVSLSDTGVYPKSNFAGSRIFNFQVGTGINDTLLGFPLEYDTYGAIMFENDLYTQTYSYRDGDIIGFHYYLTGENQYDNQWYKSANYLPAPGSSADIVVPLNLQANPNFGTPTLISSNNWFTHFSSIETNQVDYTGLPYSANNWQYTQRDLSVGTSIVQARSPLLKLMLLVGDNSLDMKQAISFAEGEYTRYKLKVRQKIKENLKAGLYTDAMVDDDEIVKIFNFIAANKTAEFAFFLSAIGSGQFFIPPTPATLGILPMVQPYFTVENGVTYIVGHDGSKTSSVDPLTDRIVMAMELRIFNSRKTEAYFPATLPYVDGFDLFSGKYRTAIYSRDEAIILQQESFENWARTNNADYQSNTSYDKSNPFTWNYGSMTDRDNAEIPGNWRGIYRWYFDTETPNLTPWEMLGFAEMPDWWVARYGSAPYKRTNTAMWLELEQGLIASGDRAGIDLRFARPDIMNVLPVDISGNLLDPVQARIVLNAPTIQIAQETWLFGDNSPIENLWRRSSSYGFAKATTLFLMRPAQFVEDYWDKDNRIIVHNTQWIDVPTNDRAASSELLVHGELLADGSQKVSYGIQSWLVEYMIQHGQTPTILGDLIRGLDVRLAHKMAGFTTSDRLSLNAESFGIIPSENVQIVLYQSPGNSADFYSGVIIESMSPSRWRVIGYNPLDPYFDVSPSDRNGTKIALTGIPDRIVNPWTPNVYYKAGMFVLYNGFVYEAIANHQSMSSFESSFWQQDDSGIAADERIYKYEDADQTTSRIAYTTVMDNRQDVVDFIYSYQRNLLGRGFGFDDGTWDNAVTKFIDWSKVDWAGGSFLTVSPGARSLTYQSAQGFVQNLEGPTANGSIVNRTGHLIDSRNTKVDRFDDTVTITASGDDIYGVSLQTGEIEHVLILANLTNFGDIIYDTVLNVRQERLKLNARRTQDWTGRYDAPGFIISNGQIVTNFEKSAEDLRYMFDIEKADNTVLRDHARHVIGFEDRPYLTSLLLNETQQFELYQGMIQQKGASGSLSKIMRSRTVEGNRELSFMEEWAFRIAEYGAYEPRGYLEVMLGQSDFKRAQQMIRLGDSIGTDPGILAIPTTDARWVSEPTDFSNIAITDTRKFYGLPNAGYVRLNEATYTATSIDDFTTQVTTLLTAGSTFNAGETVWLYNGGIDGRWAIKYLVAASNIIYSDVSNADWTYVNDAPVTPPVDSGSLADSGSHFTVLDTATAQSSIGSDTALSVTGNNSSSMPGTYLYSSRFAVVAGDVFTASMRTKVTLGFNGVAYMAVFWFKADGTPSATISTSTTMTDHRDTAGASATQREDITPQTIIVPVDAAFAKIRLTVEYSNFTANSVTAIGQVVISNPAFRRVAGNNITVVDDANTNGEVIGMRFTMAFPHGISVGETVLIAGPIGTSYALSGMFEVSAVDSDWFEIDPGDDEDTPYDFASLDEVGPQVYQMVDGRFRVRSEALDFPIPEALLYVDDAISASYVASVDTSQNGWAVYSDLDSTTLVGTVYRAQPPQIDATKVASSLIYDQNTAITDDSISPLPVTVSSITPIDPMIGVILGNADKEIDFKLEYDPAEYITTNGDTMWTDEFIGRLWWDMSTTWFINPYTDILTGTSDSGTLDTGDTTEFSDTDDDLFILNPTALRNRYLDEVKYRANNWTTLAPGASVDIYEWTKSYTTPDPTLLALHPSGLYAQSVEYSGTLNKDVPVYYFWVKNPTTVPYNTIGRTLDAASCSALISNPSAAGVPWMAVISPNEMIISGVRSYLNDDTTVMQLQLQLTDGDATKPHQQWMLIRPTDESSQPTAALWAKMRDSLVGFDDNLAAIPSTAVHVSARTGVEPAQSMFDADKKKLARESFITMINYQLARRNIGATQSFGADVLNYATPLQEYLIWSQFTDVRTLANLPPVAMYSADTNGVPLRTSDPAEMNEWLTDDTYSYRRVLLDNRFGDKPSWSVWEKNGIGSARVISIAKHYHHTVADLSSLATLVNSGAVANNEYILVQNNTDFDGFWTVHKYVNTNTTTPPPNAPIGMAIIEGGAISAMINGISSVTDSDDTLGANGVSASMVSLHASTALTEQSDGLTGRASVLAVTIHHAKSGITELNDVVGFAATISPPVVVEPEGLTLVNAQTYRTSDFWEYVDWYAEGYDANTPPIVTYSTAAVRNKNESPAVINLFVKILDNGSGYWTWTAYVDDQWVVVAQQLGTIQLSENFFNNTNLYGWNATTQTYDFNGDNVLARDGTFELGILADAILDSNVITDLEQNELWFSMINFVHAHHDQVDWAFKTSFLTIVGYNEAMIQSPVTQPDTTDFILSYIEEVKPYHVTVRDFSRSYAPPVDIGNTTVTDFDKPGYFDETTQTYRRLDQTNAADLAIMQAGSWQYWLNNMALARSFDVEMTLDRIWFATGEPVPGAAERITSFYQPTTGMTPNDLDTLLQLDFRGTVLDGMNFASIDPNAQVLTGSATSTDIDINGVHDGQMGFQMRDPRVAEDTPEDMVRLGAHDVFLLQAHDKWGAGGPQTVIKTYDVSRETDLFINIPIGMIPRDVLVFFDGLRGVENSAYRVDYLSNNIYLPIQRADGSRVQTVTVHAFGYAAHTTIIDQSFYVSDAALDPTVVAVPQSIIDYTDSYYFEVTNNGRYIDATMEVVTDGTKTISFVAGEAEHFVITYYKGDVSATTSIKEVLMPARTNPIGELLVITDNTLLSSGTYEKANFSVDFVNRYVYSPSALLNSEAHLYIKDLDDNRVIYDYSDALLFDAPIQGTNIGITQDGSTIGDSSNTNPRYRAIQIRDLQTFAVTTVLGQNGIYSSSSAMMTGTTPSTTCIPETAKIMTLRNINANTQVFLACIPGQLRVYDLSGNMLLESTTDLGWTTNSFLVQMQQTADTVTAMLINPDSPTQPVKIIKLSSDYTVSINAYTLNGYSTLIGSGGGTITAAAYSQNDNSVILWFTRTTGGQAVASYSMSTEIFKWTTWSNRSDLAIADRFHNPKAMHLSRISSGIHLVWASDLGLHGVDVRTGDYTSIASSSRCRAGEYQFWDDQTGALVASALDNNAAESIWHFVVSFPDATFSTTYSLTDILQNDFPITKPYNSSMIVERNGLRLAPPRMYIAVNVTEKFMGDDKVDTTLLRIIDDTGATSSVTLVGDDDYDNTAEILLAVRSERYIYWRDYIVFRDIDAITRKYTVEVSGTGDFTIDDTTGILTVNSIRTEDIIKTLHWRNDGIMMPQTWSFIAHSTGTYRILTRARKGSSWLTLNGRRLVEDVDYSISPTTEGAWDTVGYEEFEWDNLAEVDVVIKNMLQGHDNDLVVLTTFEGPQNTSSLHWQLTTLTPDIVRFKHNDDPADGERDYFIEPTAWATESHDLRREGGTITEEVTTGTATFNIATNALSSPEVMLATDAVMIPDASANVPGVVWLGAERIEYFKRVDLGGGIITLDQVRRGTKGTPKLDHALGTTVRVEHAIRQIPAAPLSDITPIPTPSLIDTPYVPYTPPVFEGWYLKVRFLVPIRGRDAGFYAFNYYPNAYQPNAPQGIVVDGSYNGAPVVEYGSANGSLCASNNLCGQTLLSLDATGPLAAAAAPYQNAVEGFEYNPYDFTYTFYYDVPPGHQSIQLQYSADNWTSVNAPDGSPIYIEYRWWDQTEAPVRVVTSTVGELWPYYFDWDVLAKNETGSTQGQSGGSLVNPVDDNLG